MGKEEEGEEESPNWMDIIPDLLEEIFVRLPIKSILKCRTVSKQWRSILESGRFSEKRMNHHKSRKILAAYNCDCDRRPILLPNSRFEGDEEIVYLHCDAARPSMSCDGFLCFPEQDWIVVLNPATRQLRRFPSGLNPNHKCRFGFGLWSRFTPENWAMGFGRDKVTGRFKVVRLSYYFRGIGQKDRMVECGVLDVASGEWRKLNPPRHFIKAGSKSICVNGSIYWLHIGRYYQIVALDLHKEKFHRVPSPERQVTSLTQIVNLNDHLAIAKTTIGGEWNLDIWTMETEEKGWSKTYSISLINRVVSRQRQRRWFKPVAVSKQGNLIFHDNQQRLFKYYPLTNEIRCLSLNTCVISPYVENLVPLPIKPSHPHPPLERVSKCRLFSMESSSWISKVLQRNDSRILDVTFTSLVVAGFIWDLTCKIGSTYFK